MKSAILLVCVVCIHLVHTAFGLPIEGIEQMLIASYQATNLED
jgi:hypothetical protein